MRNKTSLIIFLLIMGGLTKTPLSAQTLQSVELQMSAQLKEKLEIKIENGTITFPRSTPTYPPSAIPANENPVEITIKAAGIGGDREVFLHVHVLAKRNLESGENQIPISNVSWKATNVEGAGGNFRGGTMNATDPQLAGQWEGSGRRSGSFNFFYYNDPQPPGNYSQTVTFTLSIQ